MNTRHFNIGYVLVSLLLGIVLLAACAPAASTATFPPTTSAPVQAPTSAPVDTPTTAVTNAPTTASAGGPSTAPTKAPAASGSVALQVSQNATLGSILTDGQGRTLYLFLKDTKKTSNCYNGCASTWPPLISQGKPTLSNGVNADLVGITQRTDGSSQVTYNGWPLYYYAPDQQPGDTRGQGVGSVWYVITPTGDAFKGKAAPAAPAAAPTQASNPYHY
ncbi:MAG: hypothetical protein M1132_12065 [Chloroflexi bacterium]|nr:hypothetical protein [Chloroflexota bacterium]